MDHEGLENKMPNKKTIKFHILVKFCFLLYTYYVGTRTTIILKQECRNGRIFILKSDFKFSSYFVLDFTYVIYAWTIMIFFF
jgi:hypothetical protein